MNSLSFFICRYKSVLFFFYAVTHFQFIGILTSHWHPKQGTGVNVNSEPRSLFPFVHSKTDPNWSDTPWLWAKMCDADDTVWTVPVMWNKSHSPPPTVSSPYFHFTDVQADCDQVHNTRARSPRGRIYHYCGWTERKSNKSEELNRTMVAVDSHCLLIGIASFCCPLDSSAAQGRINSQHVQKWYWFNNAEDDLLKVFTWPFKVAPWDIVSSLAATVFAEQTERRKWAISHRCFVDNLKWWM